MHKEIKDLFLQVLWICDEGGLLGKEMFAIDGCKMPSKASKGDTETTAREEKYLKSLKKDVDNLSEFLLKNEDRIGLSGKAVKSNITDNESAKMHTSKGVVQGYVGVAAG